VRRVVAETHLCQNVARGVARLVGGQHRNRPERDPPFADAAAAAMRAVFDDPAARAVRRHATAESWQDVIIGDVDPVADRQRVDGFLVSFSVATVVLEASSFVITKTAVIAVSPPDRHRSGNSKNHWETTVIMKCSRIKDFGTSRASRGHRETSDNQSTNLGVMSSNLFGRANEIRNLGWFCLLILWAFVYLGYTTRYTIALVAHAKLPATAVVIICTLRAVLRPATKLGAPGLRPNPTLRCAHKGDDRIPQGHPEPSASIARAVLWYRPKHRLATERLRQRCRLRRG
jgi:hypothetical protein